MFCCVLCVSCVSRSWSDVTLSSMSHCSPVFQFSHLCVNWTEKPSLCKVPLDFLRVSSRVTAVRHNVMLTHRWLMLFKGVQPSICWKLCWNRTLTVLKVTSDHLKQPNVTERPPSKHQVLPSQRITTTKRRWKRAEQSPGEQQCHLPQLCHSTMQNNLSTNGNWESLEEDQLNPRKISCLKHQKLMLAFILRLIGPQ